MARPRPAFSLRLDEPDYELSFDHFTITITASDATGSYAQTVALWRWSAGVMARAALILTPRIIQTRTDHGCRQPADVCGVSGCVDLANFVEDTQPYVEIDVRQDADHDEWLTLVSTTLDQLLANDQWQPTPDDERTWREGPR
jgi:hypothetical protein